MSYIIKTALDIKTRFEPPAPMTSPLEVYCAIGTIAKAMKFRTPDRQDILLQMREKLNADIGSDGPEDECIRKIHTILMNFIRDDETTDQVMEYAAYGYELPLIYISEPTDQTTSSS